MKKVSNSVVSLDWDADLFMEHRKLGFVCAVWEYSGEDGDVIPVLFIEKRAVIVFDDDGEVMSSKNIKGYVKDTVKEGDDVFYDFVEAGDYADLALLGENNVLVDHDVCSNYLSEEDVKDIEARLQDLSGYWVLVDC